MKPSGTQKSSHMQFRYDVNGLRGIAILFVVWMHGWFDYLPGGNIGVDVFFVISGYLISSILFRQRKSGTYSLWKFYKRRIKRLAPALIIFFSLTFYLITIRFSGEVLKREAEHLMASILMIQNFQHIKMDWLKPYVSTTYTHLWSLGIEEQFYIFWPLLTGYIYNQSLKKGTQMIVYLILFSFGLQMLLTYVISGNVFERFIPFSRFWQLFFGCLIAFIQFKRDDDTATSYQPVSTQIQGQISKSSGEISLKNPTEKESLMMSVIGNVMDFFQELTPTNRKILTEFMAFLSLGTLIMCALHRRSFDGAEHLGSFILLPVTATAILIVTKNSFINKHVLTSKSLAYLAEISYAYFLWHAGLHMLYENEYDNMYIYMAALVPTILTTQVVEPLLRKNEKPWIIPLLTIPQVIIFILAFRVYNSV